MKLDAHLFPLLLISTLWFSCWQFSWSHKPHVIIWHLTPMTNPLHVFPLNVFALHLVHHHVMKNATCNKHLLIARYSMMLEPSITTTLLHLQNTRDTSKSFWTLSRFDNNEDSLIEFVCKQMIGHIVMGHMVPITTWLFENTISFSLILTWAHSSLLHF